MKYNTPDNKLIYESIFDRRGHSNVKRKDTNLLFFEVFHPDLTVAKLQHRSTMITPWNKLQRQVQDKVSFMNKEADGKAELVTARDREAENVGFIGYIFNFEKSKESAYYYITKAFMEKQFPNINIKSLKYLFDTQSDVYDAVEYNNGYRIALSRFLEELWRTITNHSLDNTITRF